MLFSGDRSSDTRSHSTQSSPEQNQPNDSKANDNKSHNSEVQSACSNHTEPAATQNCAETNNNVSKPMSMAENSSSDHDMEMGRKPPRPQAQNRNKTPPPIQRMPFVSTRGNGSNGKTVTGFLYRYTESEVSIVCVCHGSTFTPAEFVEHAGGTDVSQPLKHITVIPSTFG